MARLFNYFLMSTVLYMEIILAQDIPIAARTNFPNNETNLDKSVTEDRSSIENRKNKKLQLSVGPGIEFGIPLISYTAGLFIDSNSFIAARYCERNDYTGDSGAKSLQAATLSYKQFTGNSFYYRPGFYWRKTTHTTSIKYIYEDVGLGMSFGNEWQWENFVLGLDWFGLNHRIFKIDESLSVAGNVPPSIDIDKNFSYNLLGIYIGYSF